MAMSSTEKRRKEVSGNLAIHVVCVYSRSEEIDGMPVNT
jgi:hypothetical protein